MFSIIQSACARFDVAKALNIPEDHPLLNDILDDLQSDLDWDTKNPIAAIYKKKGLKRYKLEGVMSFKETTNKETDRDLLVASTSGSSSSGLHALPAPNTTQEGLQIKVENPDYRSLQQQLSVVKSGKIQLEKLYSQALDVKVVMQQKASDPIYQGKHKEFSTSCEGLNNFLEEVRTFLYMTEKVDGSCDCKNWSKEATSIVDQCLAHSDGIKSLIKRTKAML